MEYIKREDNVAADALSRWSYPASQGFRDISIHGNAEGDEEMNALIEQEKKETRECRVSWVENLISTLCQLFERQIHVLSEEQPQGANITRIGHLQAVVANVKAPKAPKAPQTKPTQGPQVPGVPPKLKRGIDIFCTPKGASQTG